jgi:hypothetical protein
MRVWNGDQPSRSSRAGIVERTGACATAASLTDASFAAALVDLGVRPRASTTETFDRYARVVVIRCG